MIRTEEKISTKLVDAIVDGMQEKKAEDIAILDLRGVQNAIVDFFVICSGNSDTQVSSISNSVEEKVLKKLKEKPWKQEGIGNNEWVLIDYVDVLVHVFQKNKRQQYGLEELWGDAKITHLEND
ncbi:ribosome silencing factor [Flexithrix dorotheae]|uniref:ribosome silencing factor n=1 Tax=Flexithrix dorotheae TaxID=70993 RepID=UPI000379079A|nr:ribosome silencing factor [Flexithrix dorotheae]